MSWFRWPKNADEWRNFGVWITEALTVDPIASRYLIDLRLGFKRNGKWTSSLNFLNTVTQNFWNGIFTFNIYILYAKTKKRRIPLLIPRINIASRFSYNYWFETGIGYLFDRGEFGAKLVIMNWETDQLYNPGVNAKGWEEGAI